MTRNARLPIGKRRLAGVCARGPQDRRDGAPKVGAQHERDRGAIHMARSRHRIAWIEWATPDSEFATVRVGWLIVETPTATTVGIRLAA